MDARKTIAAHTGADCRFPDFVSAHDHGQHVCLTVRGKQVRNDVKGRYDPGPMAEVVMSHDDWAKMLADAVAYKRNT